MSTQSTRTDRRIRVEASFNGLGLNNRAIWAVVAGSIKLLLDARPQYTSCPIYLTNTTAHTAWCLSFSVDHNSQAKDYLSDIEGQGPHINLQDGFNIHISDTEIEPAKDGLTPSSLSQAEVMQMPSIHCTIAKNDDRTAITLTSDDGRTPISERFLYQVAHIAEQLALSADTQTELKDLNMISDLDRSDLQRWTQKAPVMVESTIPDLVVRHVRATPQAQAVDAWDGSFTYEQLDLLSAHVAAALISAGVNTGDVIPLCFEKSRWIPVALLGVLKAGCTFMLMDVTHPTVRLQTLVDQVKATLVLSSTEQRTRAQGFAPQALEVSEASTQAPATTATFPQLEPSAVAAIMFTSGTTGTPKGMQIEHRSICSSLLAIAELCALSKTTRYYQFSSHAFDAAFGDMLMALFCGGCICMPSEEDRLNRLAESIRERNANTALLTPTVLRMLKPEDIPSFTTILSGGERVTRDLVSMWGQKVRFIIVYGPAETTIAFVCKHAVVAQDDDIKIGYPVNARAWIARLDNPQELAPIGTPGELVCESPGVARGYINDNPDNTKLYLDAPPWTSLWDLGPTSRCYRTGDLAQYAEDGEIIFIGRRDRQVKLRGQRIELEDIETKLQHHNRIVGSRIVLEVLDINGSVNLVAYISDPCRSESVSTFTATEHVQQQIDLIRERISSELPSYMWPAEWIPVKEYARTPSGKLDRRKLQTLGKSFYDSLQTGNHSNTQLTASESTLAGLWSQLLQLQQALTPGSHFFRLGGDSIRAMKLVSLAKKQGLLLTTEAVFRHPTLSNMAQSMETLTVSPAKVDSKLASPSLEAVVHKDDPALLNLALHSLCVGEEDLEDVYPCTHLQEALFSLSLAKTSLYFSQFVYRLPTNIDIRRLRIACDRAIQSFPAMRTTIISTSTALTQAVLRQPPAWNETTAELADMLAEDKQQPFQSGQPLARFTHVQHPSGEAHLVWTLHHAIYDGWSLQCILSYIREEYNSIGTGISPAKPFKAFVHHCHQVDEAASGEYWTKQLVGAPTPSWPTMPSTGYLATDESSIHHTMKTISSTHHATATILARASWALLLSEYEGSDSVVFGNSLHGRNALSSELQDVAGPTIATLPIRVEINRSQTVSHFLNGLQEQFSSMMPYEQFGLSQIRGISRELKNAASFRSLLIVQVKDGLASDDSEIRLEEVERSLHEYPLVLTLFPGDVQTELVVTYDSKVIPSAQASRLVGQFEQTFVELCTASGEVKLQDLDLTSQADKATMFRWNARSHQPFDVCIHEMVQEQVKRAPHAEALHTDEQSLDYESLGKLSDNLASELVRTGVKPGSIVGVLSEKSIWAPVSILAILKAGCAFAPLAPSHPKARLEAIAGDAKINTILCSPAQYQKALELSWRVIVVDEASIRALPEQAPEQTSTPDSLLYMITTSGTTGTPKCFAVKHKNFATGALARAPHIKRDCDARVLQFAPYVFDPSVEDILTTLMFGGCICVPSEEDIMGDLSAFVRRSRANFANITPSVAHSLEQNNLPSLKVLLLSGEAPDQGLIHKWAATGAQLMNGYGPSECSVKCSINTRLTADDARNIGHSIGTSVWVLRPANHNITTPIGALGELVIESPNLSEGYLNRPEVNKEKFITSPPWLLALRRGRPTRLYKTGDLVRHMEDGSIVYSGRGDLQLKVNGQRLEGEEVRQHVQQCFDDINVLVDTARFGGQQAEILVAYLATKGRRAEAFELDTQLQERIIDMKAQLLRQLAAVMPKYMIPTAFVAVSCIPTTANGKADRRALKAYVQQQRLAPSFMLSEKADAQIAVSTDKETLLHNLWQKLLGLRASDFGANAQFYDLGGNSLTAIRLAAAARENGFVLTPREILEHPLLSDMATCLKESRKRVIPTLEKFSLLAKLGNTVSELKLSLSTYGIAEEDVENAYPCTRQQLRYIAGEQLAPGGTTYRHVMPLPRDLDLDRFEAALDQVVSANGILRTRIVRIGADMVQIVLKHGAASSRSSNLATLEKEDKELSWALGQPQSRFRIVTEGEKRYLTWSSAHVIFDGWVRKQLLQDLDETYQHGAAPKRPQPEAFIDHVYSQPTDQAALQWIAELESKQYFSYWRSEQLAQAPRISHFLSLDIGFNMALPKGLSYATVLLTAWAITAAHIEGHENFFFTLLLGGRDAAMDGIDTLMAPTSTTSPLALSVDKTMTFRQAVEAAQAGVLDAGVVQHSLELGDTINALLASAPLLMVHPPEDYMDSPTKTLGLVRSHAEMVSGMADAFCMNFSLRPENTGVDLLLAIDENIISKVKAEHYLSCYEQVLARIFTTGDIDSVIEAWNLETTTVSSAISTRTGYQS